MVIPSQAGASPGRCRDLTADSAVADEEKVQTTNPKGASKDVVGKHNPLVVGSNPTEGILHLFLPAFVPVPVSQLLSEKL
jgi:hypothetical protein